MRVLLVFLVLFMTSCVTNDDSQYPYNANLKDITGLKFPLGWAPSEDAEFFAQGVGLPRQFNWQDKGLSGVENQGSCGSCAAMATASVLEDNVILATGKEIDFSEQYLLDWGKAGGDGQSCQGGWNYHDYHFKKGLKGAILERDYPYKARDQSPRQATPVDSIREWRELSNDVESIKHAIYNYGPVWTSVYATSEMQSYRSGVFRKCQQGQSNHAVTLVGWNDDGRYWVMKNSWGTNWGDNGYMKIPYNCNNIGYASNFIVYRKSPNPDPDPDPKPDPEPPKPDPEPEPEPEPKPEPEPTPGKKCRYEGFFKSRSGGAAVTLRLQNTGNNDVTVYWLNTTGKRVLMYRLRPGQRVRQRSYVYHGWVATDRGGRCLGMFYPLTRYQTNWRIK